MGHAPPPRRTLQVELDAALASRLPSEPGEVERLVEELLRRHLRGEPSPADRDTIERLNAFDVRHGAYGEGHSTL